MTCCPHAVQENKTLPLNKRHNRIIPSDNDQTPFAPGAVDRQEVAFLYSQGTNPPNPSSSPSISAPHQPDAYQRYPRLPLVSIPSSFHSNQVDTYRTSSSHIPTRSYVFWIRTKGNSYLLRILATPVFLFQFNSILSISAGGLYDTGQSTW
ncbi:hypothetical protein IWX49DRAFT_48728 [Phyllosticta citricarpa]|uniref:Uncharacterized protein n=1 Tax=Phyllosticta citricarpa TaxID=55181 RepID=A0ABR1MIL5_9PEZI